jgi:hypothetical protein
MWLVSSICFLLHAYTAREVMTYLAFSDNMLFLSLK